jgi:hypothetical protein
MNTFIDCFMRGFADGLMMMTPEAQPREDRTTQEAARNRKPKQKSNSVDGLWMLVTVRRRRCPRSPAHRPALGRQPRGLSPHRTR